MCVVSTSIVALCLTSVERFGGFDRNARILRILIFLSPFLYN